MCSLCRLLVAKNYNFGQILTFMELLYRPPFTDGGQIWCAIADSRYSLTPKFRLDRFLSPSGGENPPILAVFWTSAFSGVANWQQSEKVEHGCTTIDLPLSNGIKIVSVLRRLHGEIGRKISHVQKCDEQPNKQTDRMQV